MDAGIVENMGKFDRVASAGLVCVKFPLETIVGRVNLQTNAESFVCETKTKGRCCIFRHFVLLVISKDRY